MIIPGDVEGEFDNDTSLAAAESEEYVPGKRMTEEKDAPKVVLKAPGKH